MSSGCVTITATRVGEMQIYASLTCPLAEATRRYRTADGYLYAVAGGGYYILLNED